MADRCGVMGFWVEVYGRLEGFRAVFVPSIKYTS